MDKGASNFRTTFQLIFGELMSRFVLVPAAAFLLIIAWLFGMTGLILGLTIFVLYFLPVYCLISTIVHLSATPALDRGERIFLSLFLSLGIIPAIAYYLGFLFSNLLVGLILASLLLLAACQKE